MRKLLPVILLLTGLSLLLYPSVSQCLTTAAQQRAIAACAAQEGDSDLLGYLTIPSLDLTLPIRSGTSEAVLREGLGLLEGTQFGTHAVLCGHRGLPEARLFRDLDQLTITDRFTVTLGDQVMTYQVDRILVVSPEASAALLPESGLELCTLLTCTPYGINTHRLLVRGQRIDKTR